MPQITSMMMIVTMLLLLLLQVYLPSRGACPVAVLRALLPGSYPSAVGPVLELDAPHLQQQQLEAAVRECEDMFCPGEL
jgi:hypothetical protein